MPTVLVTDGFMQPGEPGGIRLLEQAGVELRFVQLPAATTNAELIEHLQGCMGVLAGSQRFTDEVFAGAPQLRIVARLGVGYDAIDLEAATRHGVLITTAPGTLEWAVADHTFGLLLALAHHITQDDRAMRRGEWRPFWGVDVWRKTLGLVGLGRIGRMVAQRARGFEMRILAHEPQPDMAFVQEYGIELVSLEELLHRADFVSLHTPLTPQTRQLINAERLALMQPSAYLINTARGGLVDEDALYAALTTGGIAGAGLDVRQVEPPTDSRFATLDNVVLTPHDSGLTDGRRLACGTMAAGSILSVLADQRPDGLLNVDAWERRRTGPEPAS
ncbi:MAG TPA: phosphoglycerate dehydrogenase [Chloroflexota bacterium]|nr:phosphoglycerate dehydrogenase [Chloroflexota bacterium]